MKTPSAAATPTPQITVGTPESTTVPSSESKVVRSLTNNCGLLGSRELASFFPSAEVVVPTPQVSQVKRTVFSTESVSAREVSCVYLVFYHPGKKDQVLLQVTYWVDLPDQITSSVWSQVWADAASKATQAVAGVGDQAFFEDGRLSFKKGSVYVTVEAVDTQINTQTPAGENQQRQQEKKIALDALDRWP
ncbi:MAG TPA: hypothetical protein VE136_18710 [Anaerolineales bacterium]|nr:hypothetical protein [Anaerolineales bacterium]